MCMMRWTGEKMMLVSGKGPAAKGKDPVSQGKRVLLRGTGVSPCHPSLAGQY